MIRLLLAALLLVAAASSATVASVHYLRPTVSPCRCGTDCQCVPGDCCGCLCGRAAK